MNMYIRDIAEEDTIVEDIIVPYTNIKITHVNDNRPPLTIMIKKTVTWLLVISLMVGLLLF